MKTLAGRLSALPGIEKVALCFEAPASGANSFTNIRFDNREKDEPWEINLKEGDDQYLSTFELKLVAGRNFLPSDTTREFLVNETFLKKVGVEGAENVIGRRLSVNGSTLTGTIVGVIGDFYNNSFRESISPVCVMIDYHRFQYCALKIRINDLQSQMASIGEVWNENYADQVFSYQFVDDRIAKFYELDTVMLKIVQAFALIAILISCLGLYGLISFMAVRKTKEIGIRKVLGASVQTILWLFGREFTLLLIIAFAFAAPAGYFVMDRWLQGFTYHLPVPPISFLLAIVGTFVIAMVTVAYHSIKSATADPVKSLRDD
jgi:ABC-type antimicrobial peptide transport system permease subunit